MNLNNQPPLESKNDEIDLLELFVVLWNKKWWILLFGFIGAALGGAYTLIAKEKWTSKTEILQPTLEDLGDYLIARKEYARIVGEPFDIGALSAALHGEFGLRMYSLDDREEFLESSNLYQHLSKDKSDSEKRSILYTLARNNIKLTKADPKKEPDLIGRKISVTAESPMMAQETLKAYLDFLNQKVISKDIKNLHILLNEKVKELEFEYEMIKRNLVVNRSIQLENLNKAYLTAQKAEIKEYSRPLNEKETSSAISILASDAKVSLADSELSDGSYLFMLGEKYLKAQIDVIAEKEIVYPPRYYDVERQLSELKVLLSNFNVTTAQVFSYLSSPDYPNKKDGISGIIITLSLALLSMILACILCLLRAAFQKRKENYRLGE